jgi:hypothetical protein
MEQHTRELSPARTSTQRAPALPVIFRALAMAGGITLRWIGLGQRSLWFDEGYTAWVVSLPMREIVRMIRVDTAPPLYYLLLHGWTKLFGQSEAALRSMSALMASVAVLVFALIARKILVNSWSRTVAITLFCFSFMQIAYAHEARFYAMMTMMGAIDFYLVLLICRRSSAGRLTGLIIAWTLSLYTNNMMAFYLACLGSGWLILPGERRLRHRVRDLLIVSISSGILFAPWVPAMLAQAIRLRAGFWPARPDGWVLLRAIGVMTGAHEQALPKGDGHWFAPVAALLVGFVGLSFASRRHWRFALALVGFGIAPILLIFAYSHLGSSIFVERAFLASGVALPLLLVLPMEAARSWPAKLLVTAGLFWILWLSAFSLPGRFTGEQTEGWREACDYAAGLAPRHRALTVFAANEGELMYDYYARHGDYSRRSDLIGTPLDFFDLDPPRTLQRVRKDSDVDQLRSMLDNPEVDSVVLISSHIWWGDSRGRTLSLISSRFAEVNEHQFAQIQVYWFAGRKVSPQRRQDAEERRESATDAHR